MKLNEYQALMTRTLLGEDTQLMCVLGLTGEAGEVADYIKKVKYHQHDLNLNKLTEELGDVLWYLAATAWVYGISLENIAEENIYKLKRRYPNGFEVERSINREGE
ncbi:MAG: pyrophosphatase [Firmicutes bacterium]|nr:pyrophosphatase [Bacillota bacterium]